MRRSVVWAAVAAAIVVLLAARVGAALHAAGAANGVTLTVNGEAFDGPVVVAMFGGLGVFAAFVVAVFLVATVVSVAIVVPVVLALLGASLLAVLVVGTLPLLVPGLLLGGACALLFRRRRTSASVAATGASEPDSGRPARGAGPPAGPAPR